MFSLFKSFYNRKVYIQVYTSLFQVFRMNNLKEGEHYIFLYKKYRYEGELLSYDDICYNVNDKLDGFVSIPRNNTVVKEVKNG